MKLILESDDLKFEFSTVQRLRFAVSDLSCDGIGERARKNLIQNADVVYDKKNQKFLKHRFISDTVANEILEFTK